MAEVAVGRSGVGAVAGTAALGRFRVASGGTLVAAPAAAGRFALGLDGEAVTPWAPPTGVEVGPSGDLVVVYEFPGGPAPLDYDAVLLEGDAGRERFPVVGPGEAPINHGPHVGFTWTVTLAGTAPFGAAIGRAGELVLRGDDGATLGRVPFTADDWAVSPTRVGLRAVRFGPWDVEVAPATVAVVVDGTEVDRGPAMGPDATGTTLRAGLELSFIWGVIYTYTEDDAA